MTPEEIKKARKILGKTQTELGELLGSKLRTVQAWEKGDRNMPKITQTVLQNIIREHAQSEYAQRVFEEAI
jgi:DNA-binding transcriptional regulator YiaG